MRSGNWYNTVAMPKYPIYLDLREKRVVVIGAGTVAARKIQTLIDTQARLVVVSEHASTTFERLCEHPNVELIISNYSINYLAEAVLAIAATNDNLLNQKIYKDCQQLEVLCNVVDNPQLCDFYIPAVVNRNGLQIAVGTDGKCPAYAGHIRKKLEDMFTEAHGKFLDELETIRKKIIDEIPNPEERKAILGQLVADESFESFIKNSPAAWRDRAENMLAQNIP